ncbi:uncharacterized protein LOC144123169 [Amblyomma americanum]
MYLKATRCQTDETAHHVDRTGDLGSASRYGKNIDSFRAEKRNAKVYETIAQGLARSGINKSRKQVQSKIDNLTQAYRILLHAASSYHSPFPAYSGAYVQITNELNCFRNCAKQRTTGSAPVAWIYFSEIHRFLGSLPANDHSLVDESMTVEQVGSSFFRHCINACN